MSFNFENKRNLFTDFDIHSTYYDLSIFLGVLRSNAGASYSRVAETQKCKSAKVRKCESAKKRREKRREKKTRKKDT